MLKVWLWVDVYLPYLVFVLLLNVCLLVFFIKCLLVTSGLMQIFACRFMRSEVISGVAFLCVCHILLYDEHVFV